MLVFGLVLELIRIIALLILVTYPLNLVFSHLLGCLELHNQWFQLLQATFGVLLSIGFAFWYRRWGQYQGWYPTKKNY